jgi:hypothetical protein
MEGNKIAVRRFTYDDIDKPVKKPFNIKQGDKVKLSCGHEGKVVWVEQDEGVIAVRGVSRSCRYCGKKSMGVWVPTVHLITLRDL